MCVKCLAQEHCAVPHAGQGFEAGPHIYLMHWALGLRASHPYEEFVRELSSLA